MKNSTICSCVTSDVGKLQLGTEERNNSALKLNSQTMPMNIIPKNIWNSVSLLDSIKK